MRTKLHIEDFTRGIEDFTRLLMKDRHSRAIQAWIVQREGPDLDAAAVAQRALMGLRSSRHRGCVLFETDNEPAILSLKEEMMRRLESGAIPVESASHDLGNGSVEICLKIFKGLLRVHVLALERKLYGNIPS